MLNDLFIAAVEARGKTVYYFDTELLPFPLTSAGAYPSSQGETQVHTRVLHVQETSRQRTLGSHGALYKVLGWCPEKLGHGMTGGTSTGKYSDSFSHADEVVLCETSLKTRSQGAFCTVHFTYCSLFFLTPLCFCFSGVHYYSPLPLFPWHSTFYPFWFFSFSLQYFFFLLLLFPCWFSAVFPPVFTDFSPWQLGIEPNPAEVNPLHSKSLGSRSYSRLLLCFFYNLFSYAAFSVVFSF